MQQVHRAETVEPQFCRLCGRVLHAADTPGLPAGDPSTDCGGDCWGCIEPIERHLDERYGVENAAEWR